MLSVVIPAHNSAATVGRAVNSVLRQLSSDVEVIVVDDGSDLDPAEVLQQQLADGRCSVIRQTNLGASVARNTGLEAARGDLVMFVDADDELVDGSLHPFLQAARRSEADVAISDFFLRRGASEKLVAAVNTDRVELDFKDRAVLQRLTLARVGFGGEPNVGLLGAPWAKIYRTDFLRSAFGDGAPFTPGVLRGQDVLFNTEAFGKIRTVYYYNRPTYAYTVSSESASHRFTENFIDRVSTLVLLTHRLIQREEWDYLNPALSKMTVTLMEEALQRSGRSLRLREVRRVLGREIFRSAVRSSLWADFSWPGRVKLAAYRLGALPTLGLMRVLALVRRT